MQIFSDLFLTKQWCIGKYIISESFLKDLMVNLIVRPSSLLKKNKQYMLQCKWFFRKYMHTILFRFHISIVRVFCEEKSTNIHFKNDQEWPQEWFQKACNL